MKTDTSSSAEDWRERFLKLADEHERDGKSRDEVERELIRLVTRLCVAVSGLDPALDPHLERLRKAAKRGGSTSLLRQADELADALVHVSEDRARPGVLERLLERSGQARRQIDEVLKAWAAVAADPAAARDAELDKLAKLLGLATPADGGEAEARGGLFQRILGKPANAPAARDASTYNRRLSEVLAALPWPDGMRGAIDEGCARLAASDDGEVWGGVLNDVGECAISAITEAEDNARAAQSFLAELSRHLEAFDDFMVTEAGRSAAAHSAREQLGRFMNDEVETLSDSVRQSASLAELQASVLGSLQRMQAHVRDHIEDENSRRTQAEAEAETLRARLRDVERDTFDLRRQVALTAEQALRDPLTGLPNRRAYDERVAQEQARYRRFGEPLALLVLDVDNFKQINDTFGHKAGDKALVMIARTLSGRVRATDFIARFGGEEFVLLLPGAPPDAAMALAEIMREAVAEAGLHASGKPVKVTVSGGLALFAKNDAAEAVFERADQALYKAKAQGKKQVVAG